MLTIATSMGSSRRSGRNASLSIIPPRASATSHAKVRSPLRCIACNSLLTTCCVVMHCYLCCPCCPDSVCPVSCYISVVLRLVLLGCVCVVGCAREEVSLALGLGTGPVAEMAATLGAGQNRYLAVRHVLQLGTGAGAMLFATPESLPKLLYSWLTSESRSGLQPLVEAQQASDVRAFKKAQKDAAREEKRRRSIAKMEKRRKLLLLGAEQVQ